MDLIEFRAPKLVTTPRTDEGDMKDLLEIFQTRKADSRNSNHVGMLLDFSLKGTHLFVQKMTSSGYTLYSSRVRFVHESAPFTLLPDECSLLWITFSPPVMIIEDPN